MKTKLKVFLLVLMIILNITVLLCSENNSWSSYPVIPGNGPLYGHASAVSGDTLYVAGGSINGTASNIMYRYSISGNSWSIGNSLPAARTGGDLVSARGKIFYTGGGNSSLTNALPQQFVYDPVTGVWSAIADIPVPVTGNVSDVYNDSLIYCIMGGWSSYETIVQVYNIELNSWSLAAQFPDGYGRRTFACAIWGNKIFVCGGYDGSFRSDFWIGTIDESDCRKISWDQMTGLQTRTSRPGGTAINGKFYVVLGELPDGTGSDLTAVWDTETGKWTYFEGKPTRTNNLNASVSSSIEISNGKKVVKIWAAGGSIEQQTGRPLEVFIDAAREHNFTGKNVNNDPLRYELNQNYPNPFNPVTKIDITIPVNTHVRLTVFDITGREAVVLLNEFIKAGKYTFVFDGQKFASGIYYYAINSREFTDCKKMILVK